MREISGIRDSLPKEIDDFSCAVELDFSSVVLGDRGCYTILELVRVCYKLEVLKLSNCGLSNDITGLLGQVLTEHPTLQYIDVSDNCFLTAPSGDKLLLACQANENIISVDVSGTNVPSDLEKRINKIVEKNVNKFLNKASQAKIRSFKVANAVDLVLSKTEKYELSYIVRRARLNEMEFESCSQAISVDGSGLPKLFDDENNRAIDCFTSADINNSGSISYSGVIKALKLYGLVVEPEDAYLINLFSKLDVSEESILTQRQWLIFLRNFLTYEGETWKATYLSQLRGAFMAVSESDGESGIPLLKLSSCLLHLSKITGIQMDDVFEDKCFNFLRVMSNTNSDDSVIRIHLRDFTEALLVMQCVTFRSFRTTLIYHKLSVNPAKER